MMFGTALRSSGECGGSNSHDVYMHGTPAHSLFAKDRRDFSHGCVRVADPIALAEWVLRDDDSFRR